MPDAGKLRGSVRTVALPLALSLLVHGLLLLVLWFWPIRKGSPTLTIQSTRIALDTCVLDSPASTLLAEQDLPPDLIGPSKDITFAPRLEGPTPPLAAKHAAPVPGSGSSVSSGKEKGKPIGGEKLNNPSSGRGSLFPVPTSAGSVVFVLDRSVSMGIDRKLEFARQELIASLRKLPPAVRFQVIDYNEYAELLVIDGQRDLLPAEPTNVAKAITHLESLAATGKTNHLGALCRGIELRPDVLFFLTDADDLRAEEIASITKRNQHTIVHTIELTRRRSAAPDGPLAELARANHGTYRRVSLDD